MTPALLQVEGLRMRFGGLWAIDDIGFQVRQNEIFALIGPNGAGKTTVFNCIGGFYRPTQGRIFLDERPVTGRPSHWMARQGVVRTFQNIRLFRNLTVLENLLVAQHRHLKTGLLPGLFGLPSYRAAERQGLRSAMAWLDRMGLADHAQRQAGSLPYGLQRKLEIARCMITRPRLLLLDEPAAGLNATEKSELSRLIEGLRREHGIAILLIEHDMGLVMGISDSILVMEQGRPIALGMPDAVRTDPRVIKAYLGEA